MYICEKYGLEALQNVNYATNETILSVVWERKLTFLSA